MLFLVTAFLKCHLRIIWCWKRSFHIYQRKCIESLAKISRALHILLPSYSTDNYYIYLSVCLIYCLGSVLINVTSGMVNPGCQLDTPGKRECWLRKCLVQTGLWACPWDVFLIAD